MFHRYRIWAIESFPSFSLLESWSKISPRAMRFQKENEIGKLWAQIRWKKTMLSIASEKKETIGSMADARSWGPIEPSLLFFTEAIVNVFFHNFPSLSFLFLISSIRSCLRSRIGNEISRQLQDEINEKRKWRKIHLSFLFLFNHSWWPDRRSASQQLVRHQDYMIERN